jgi:hypothetical protein
MYKIPTLLFLTLLLVSCDYFKQETDRIPVARVNANYLYEDDIRELINENTTEEDSTLIVSNYITRWATQQLLIDQAKINLSSDKLESYENLVRDYKNDLYTEAYKSAIVNKQLDSVISEVEFENFYTKNMENFKLNDELVMVRYIHVGNTYNNLPITRDQIKRFSNEDIDALNKVSIQFISYNFNDSVWVKKEALFEALPILFTSSKQVLKKSNFTQLQDSLGVYLVKIEDVRKTNDIAPLTYIKPTIEQIILNKRKLELIKKLEKDITKDAIKNRNFETFTDH